jgi:Na+-translocating ferredoxin:NAD+ oxidoreductase RnfG subunit
LKYLLYLFFSASVLSAHATFSSDKVVKPQDVMAHYFANKDVKISRKNIILSSKQYQKAQQSIKTKIKSKIQRFYLAKVNGKTVGYGGLITTRIRTKNATALVILDESGKTLAVEVLAFFEPKTYFPTENWLNNFNGKTISDAKQLQNSIPVITGATLTSASLTKATKTILAVWNQYFKK